MATKKLHLGDLFRCRKEPGKAGLPLTSVTMNDGLVQRDTLGRKTNGNLMPEGLPINTSTLISGPGGSGKPLIGDNFVAAWLRQGGSAVFMSLQYPNREFLSTSLRTVTGLDVANYLDRVAFIELDVTIDGMETPDGNSFKANLVKPAIWDASIEQACSLVSEEGPGIMVFGSALNLLLFSIPCL